MVLWENEENIEGISVTGKDIIWMLRYLYEEKNCKLYLLRS